MFGVVGSPALTTIVSGMMPYLYAAM